MFQGQDLNLTVQDTAVGEGRNKTLYKSTLVFLKIIPMLIALCDVLNMGLSLYGINLPLLSYLGGVSFLTLTFLYLASYAFGFCIYHRLFLHYSLIINILNTLEYYIFIPISTQSLTAIYLTITGIFFFLILYFRKKCFSF